jgi:hypothetical protein
MRRKIAATATLTTLALAALALPASAEDVVATFEVPAGELTVVTNDADKAVTFALDGTLLGGATASGTLGLMNVTDTRTASTGWTVSVSSTDFVSGTNTVAASKARMYVLATDGPTIVSGTVVPATTHVDAATALTLATTSASFMTATATGANEVTYTPTVEVTLESTTAAGTYSGTITQTAA